jgi:hypothetical protein
VEIVALVLALVALALPFLVELVKRPRIEIAARPWTPSKSGAVNLRDGVDLQ